ncbi:hypothetical protein FACS1894113_0280 [Alphaproteobacteria bacterium]|nr:hypothetical protein FACS1894113_0280 [Alphaproteobacteria bacterium]
MKRGNIVKILCILSCFVFLNDSWICAEKVSKSITVIDNFYYIDLENKTQILLVHFFSLLFKKQNGNQIPEKSLSSFIANQCKDGIVCLIVALNRLKV